MNDHTKKFIEKNFTTLLCTFLIFSFCLFAIPNAIRHVASESLTPIKGHLKDLQTQFATKPEQNSFHFSLEEYPEKTFMVTGLQLIDQSLLTHIEEIGNEFTLSIQKGDLEKNLNLIPVFQLSTKKNVYLTVRYKASSALKERLLAVFLILTAFSVGLRLTIKLLRDFKNSSAEENLDYIDPFMISTARYPKLIIATITLIYFILLCVPLPLKAIPYCFAILVFVYFIFLIWFLKFGSHHPWILSLISRDNDRRAQLSVKLMTTIPSHFKAVELLIKKGARVNIQDHKGRTPLIISSELGELEAVSLLLKKGADPNLADHAGITPLIAAITKGHLGIVTKLLKAGSKAIYTTSEGITPLEVALQHEKNISIIDVITRAVKQEEKKIKTLDQDEKIKI